jgi:osmotically-inducible protein OsmY
MTALVGDPQLRGAELHVNVEGDKVGITGRAKDAAQARHARDAAQAAAGSAVVDSHVTAG